MGKGRGSRGTVGAEGGRCSRHARRRPPAHVKGLAWSLDLVLGCLSCTGRVRCHGQPLSRFGPSSGQALIQKGEPPENQPLEGLCRENMSREIGRVLQPRFSRLIPALLTASLRKSNLEERARPWGALILPRAPWGEAKPRFWDLSLSL